MPDGLDLKSVVRSTYTPPAEPQRVQVTNARDLPWFTIGFQFGFGFLFASLIFSIGLAILYAVARALLS